MSENNSLSHENSEERTSNKNKKRLITILVLLSLIVGGVITAITLGSVEKSDDITSPTPTMTQTPAPVVSVTPTPTPTVTQTPEFKIKVDEKEFTSQKDLNKAVNSAGWKNPVFVCNDGSGFNDYFTTNNVNPAYVAKNAPSADRCLGYITEPTKLQIALLLDPEASSKTPDTYSYLQGAYPFDEVVTMYSRTTNPTIKGTDKFFYYEAMSDYSLSIFDTKAFHLAGIPEMSPWTLEDGLLVNKNPNEQHTLSNGWVGQGKMFATPETTITTPAQEAQYKEGWKNAVLKSGDFLTR